MPQCPHCEAELDHIEGTQNTSGYERFTARFPNVADGSNWDYGDSETTDTHGVDYQCPECGEDISDSQLQIMEEAWADTHPQQTMPSPRRRGRPQADGEGDRMNLGTNHRRFHAEQTGGNMVECPNCHHTYIDDYTLEMICPGCNQTWNPPENLVSAIPIENSTAEEEEEDEEDEEENALEAAIREISEPPSQ